MKAILSILILCAGYQAMSCDSRIYLPKSMTDASAIPARIVTVNNYSLAVNIDYPPVVKVRKAISKYLGVELDFFKGWDAEGEAHITTITPPNFDMFGPKLSQHFTKEEIDQFGRDYRIQEADIEILGVGSAKGMVTPPNCKGCDKVESEVFFLIVRSEKLVEIRESIHAEFVKRGGNPKDFDPYAFYPHITIGYTVSDIHNQPKDITSLDKRFPIAWE